MVFLFLFLLISASAKATGHFSHFFVVCKGKPSVQFCGVREPYTKPFKADIMSLQPNGLDIRIAVRTSPRPLAGDSLRYIKEFAATIQPATSIEVTNTRKEGRERERERNRRRSHEFFVSFLLE